MATKTKQDETDAELKLKEREVQLQFEANEDFFVNSPCYSVDLKKEELKKDLLRNDLKNLDGKFFSITGWDASNVVALLSCIVNQWKKEEKFYLLLNKAGCNEPPHEVFRLTARPTEHQSGNGFVLMRPSASGKETFPAATTYEDITAVIEKKYENEKETKERSSERFWEDLQKLFHDNTSADSIPDVALEVYLLLLFEIARRLVRQPDQKITPRKKALDRLPIGVAIARMLVVKPDFRKVLLPGEKFNCFNVPSSGDPGAERRKRIIYLNEAFGNPQEVGLKSKEGYLKELENAFLRPATEQATPTVTQKPCTDVLDLPPENLDEDESDELCNILQDFQL